MPLLLVTGLNGFVAVNTAKKFLENGWDVRGTVRSKDKGDKVKALPCFEQYQGRIATVVVEDLIKGDFTAALQGVDGIAHLASPWHFRGNSWAEYYDPAVNGTTNILEQAAKVESVKAVSVISSFAAIGDFSIPFTEQAGKVYTEDDWLPLSEKDCENMQGDMAPAMWYCGSKKYAEKAALETPKRVGAKYSLSTVCPPVVLGPALHYAQATGEELANSDVSTTDIYKAMASGKNAPVPDTPFPIYADVRNVAETCYELIVRKKSGRWPLYNGAFDYQLLADKAREFFPEADKKGSIPTGKPGDNVSKKDGFRLDGSKAERELGIKYIPMDQTIKDAFEQMVKLGAVKA